MFVCTRRESGRCGQCSYGCMMCQSPEAPWCSKGLCLSLRTSKYALCLSHQWRFWSRFHRQLGYARQVSRLAEVSVRCCLTVATHAQRQQHSINKGHACKWKKQLRMHLAKGSTQGAHTLGASALDRCTMRPLQLSMTKGPAHVAGSGSHVGTKGGGVSLPCLCDV